MFIQLQYNKSMTVSSILYIYLINKYCLVFNECAIVPMKIIQIMLKQMVFTIALEIGVGLITKMCYRHNYIIN